MTKVSIDTKILTRPTHKELSNKLRPALSILMNGQVFLINQTAMAVDALELEYLIETELKEVP
ncbi:MAG: hypothetical protein WC836_20110 [Desulfobacula sp.]